MHRFADPICSRGVDKGYLSCCWSLTDVCSHHIAGYSVLNLAKFIVNGTTYVHILRNNPYLHVLAMNSYLKTLQSICLDHE